MITEDPAPWGLHPKSGIAGQGTAASSRLTIEWTAQL